MGNRWTWTARTETGNQPIRTVRADNEGWLWVSQTPSGLIRFHPATSRVERVDKPVEITQGRLNGVHTDPDGTVWLASAKGLFRRPPGARAPNRPGCRR